MTFWRYALTLHDIWTPCKDNEEQTRRYFLGAAIERLKALRQAMEHRHPHQAKNLRCIIDEFELLLNAPEVSRDDIDELMKKLWDWADDENLAFIDVVGMIDLSPGVVRVYE